MICETKCYINGEYFKIDGIEIETMPILVAPKQEHPSIQMVKK